MKADRIKISMEFNVMGNGIWLTAESAVAPDEDVIEEFKKGRDILIQSFRAMNEGSFHAGGSATYGQAEPADPIADRENERLFQQTKSKISKVKTREMAELILNASGFKFNIQLREIVLSKPSKTSNNGKDK